MSVTNSVNMFLPMVGAFLRQSTRGPYTLFINKFISLLDKHIPEQISKPNKYKHKKHPWITQAILKSIHTRDHLSKKRIHSKATPEINNIDQQYKQYRNLLNRVIRNAKSQYWNTKFTESKNNIKQTWTNIKNILHVPKKAKFTVIILNRQRNV